MAGILSGAPIWQKIGFALSGLGSGGQGRMSNMLGIHQQMLERAKMEKEEQALSGVMDKAAGHLDFANMHRAVDPKGEVFKNPMERARRDILSTYAGSGVQSLAGPALLKLIELDQPDLMEVNGVVVDKRNPGTPLADYRTPKESGPESPMGKLRADFLAGRIDKQTYDALVAKETAAPAGPAPPSGYRNSSDGKSLEAIPGGPADIGLKGKPLKYKDAVNAFTQMEGTLKEYKKLAEKHGTEWWDAGAAARLEALETQLKFGVKGIEQTGALDEGSLRTMEGMVPTATGLNAFNPRGGAKLVAKLDEFDKYLKRSRAALDTAYGASGGEAADEPAGGDATELANSPDGTVIEDDQGTWEKRNGQWVKR